MREIVSRLLQGTGVWRFSDCFSAVGRGNNLIRGFGKGLPESLAFSAFILHEDVWKNVLSSNFEGIMFECRACVLRSIRAIAGDSINVQHLPRSRNRLILTPRLSTPPIRCAISSVVATRDDEPDDLVPGAQPISEETQNPTDGKKQKGLTPKDERALRTELKYLSDPVKLAEHVRYTLRRNQPEKALDLCRLASKQQEVIVSWNHCVDWYMTKGRVDEGIRIYNEMKKRAQFPDSYTYILLLRGLARTQSAGEVVKKANVTKALSIYNSMSSPTSRVRPAIIHTNSMLRVCSAALDMDALWSVAGKLPSKGKGAPDHMTYAILLHAIRHGAMGDNPSSAQLEHIAGRRQEAVNQGRRIWQEIIPKWRAGEVEIDEELVCAMGRLLLISKRMKDWDDVLSLVHQTMNIERQIAAIGSEGRNTGHIPQEIQSGDTADEPQEDADGYRDAPSTKAFNPVTASSSDQSHGHGPRGSNLAYVTPGNPTLSLLIDTCTYLRTPRTANAYWDLLTSSTGPYTIQPDLANFHAQFRLLGINRSSARAVQVLRSMSALESRPKNQTFRIVMSICVRDKNNHNCVEHARAVVDEMEKHSSDPDVHTLTQYLNLALTSDNGPKIVSALDRLDPIVHNLRSRITYGADEKPASHAADLRDKHETIAFLQAMVGVIDTLMNRSFVPREDFNHWHGRRSMLTQFIGRARAQVEKQTEVLNGKRVFSGRNRLEDGGAESQTRRELERLRRNDLKLRAGRIGEKEMARREEGHAAGSGRSWARQRGRREGPPREREEKGGWGFADTPLELSER